jgi:hypothetical protein
MPLEIFYKPDDWKPGPQGAGESGVDNTRMRAPYNTGLLHLINYLMHTQAGRDFMHSWIPGKNGETAQSIRAPLLQKFGQFGVVDSRITESLIGAHVAGFSWVDAFSHVNPANRDPVKMAQQETIFNQHVAAISWFLWEESQGPMFSLGW